MAQIEPGSTLKETAAMLPVVDAPGDTPSVTQRQRDRERQRETERERLPPTGVRSRVVDLKHDCRALPQRDICNSTPKAAATCDEAVVLWVRVAGIIPVQHVRPLARIELETEQRFTVWVTAAADRAALLDAEPASHLLFDVIRQLTEQLLGIRWRPVRSVEA